MSEEEQQAGFYYKFNEKVLFRTDSKTQMEYLRNGVGGSILMVNEARRKLDLPDAEGGNVLIANGNIVPLTQAGAAYATKDNLEKVENGKIEDDTSERSEEDAETI